MALEQLVICLAAIVQLLTVYTAVSGQHVKVLIFNVTVRSHTDPHRPAKFSSQFAQDQFMEFYRCLCDQDIQECRAHTSLYGTVTYTQHIPRLPVTHAQRDAFSSRHRCQADLDTLTVLCTRLLYSDPLCSYMTGCVSYQLVSQGENGQCPPMEIVWETGQTLRGHYDDQLIQLQPCDLSCDADVTAIATTASSITPTNVNPIATVTTFIAGSPSQPTTPDPGILFRPSDEPKTANETLSTSHQNEPQYYSNDHSNRYTDNNNYYNYDNQNDHHTVNKEYTDNGHDINDDYWNNSNDNDFASIITTAGNSHYQKAGNSFLKPSDNDYDFGAGKSKSTNLTIGLGIGALMVLLGLLLLLILLRKFRRCRIQHVNSSSATQKLSGPKLLAAASAVLPSQSKQTLCAEEFTRESSYVHQINTLYEPAHLNRFQTFPYSHYEEITPIPKVGKGREERRGDSHYAVAMYPSFPSGNHQPDSQYWAVHVLQMSTDVPPPTPSKSHYDRSIVPSEKTNSNERSEYNSWQVDPSLYCTVNPKTTSVVPTHYEEMVQFSYETSVEETEMKNMISSTDFCVPPGHLNETNNTRNYKRIDPIAKTYSSIQSGNLYEEISEDSCTTTTERSQFLTKTNIEVAKIQTREREMDTKHGSRRKNCVREDRASWCGREASTVEQSQDKQTGPGPDCLELMGTFVSLSGNTEFSHGNTIGAEDTHWDNVPTVDHYFPMRGQIDLSTYIQTDKHLFGQTQTSDSPRNGQKECVDGLQILEEQTDILGIRDQTEALHYSNIEQMERQADFSRNCDKMDGANCTDNAERQTNCSDISDEIDRLDSSYNTERQTNVSDVSDEIDRLDSSDNTERQTNFSDVSDEIDGLSSFDSIDEQDQAYYSQISEEMNQRDSQNESEIVHGQTGLRGHSQREGLTEQAIYSKINKDSSFLQDQQSKLGHDDRNMVKTSCHVSNITHLPHGCQSSNFPSNHGQSFPHMTPPPDNPSSNQPIRTNSAPLASKGAGQNEERSKQRSGFAKYGLLYVNSPAKTVTDQKSALPAWLDQHFYYELESDQYSSGSRNSGEME